MANVRPATPGRNNMLNAIRDLLDAGTGAATIKFYTGTQPANGDAALAGNILIGTLTCTDPSAPNAASGVLTFNAIADDSAADAAGTITWARAQDSAGTNVLDCDVGTAGATINMSSVTVAIGDILRITSFTLTAPA